MADGVLVTDVLEGHGLLPDEATVDAAGHVTASLATMEHPGHVRPGGHDPQDREDDGNSPLQEDGIRQERGHDCGCQRPDGTEHKFDIAYKNHPQRGYIGLQDHGSPCWFKNIKLKPLK